MSAPTALSIAGSDPSGGAGIQADLKTFSALGAYGCAVLTALTAQNTRGVTGIHRVPPEFVRDQVLTLVDDVQVDAVKIGMLGSAAVAEVVADLVREVLDCPVVLDPVMVSTAGARLLDRDAVEAVLRLAPLADLVTPNGPEAAVMLGCEEAQTVTQQTEQAQELYRRLGTRVLLKGGHLPGPLVTDVLVDHDGAATLTASRVVTENTHGTGCTLSSAIAALLPRHAQWRPAVQHAKRYLTEALRQSEQVQVGHGAGPVHHFHEWW